MENAIEETLSRAGISSRKTMRAERHANKAYEPDTLKIGYGGCSLGDHLDERFASLDANDKLYGPLRACSGVMSPWRSTVTRGDLLPKRDWATYTSGRDG